MPIPTDPVPTTHEHPATAPDRGDEHGLDGYRRVERLDTPSDGVGWWLAAGPDGTPCVLMTPEEACADDASYRLRFWSEANNSRRLGHRYVATVKGVSAAGARIPWVAYDCFPALPLGAALAVHGGPLPQQLVRRWGVALAEALWSAHSRGLVHAGISPQSVLLTPSGPLLTGYGLVRAASVEGAERHAVPGVAGKSLPPEQRAGGRPQPPGDIYALAAVLAFAEGAGNRQEIPSPPWEEVRARCLTADPAERPRAEELLRILRDSAPAAGGQLPERILAAMDEQAAQWPAYPPEGAPTAVPPGHRTDEAASAAGLPTAAAPPTSPSRRSLLTAVAPAAAGLALGTAGVATWRAFGSQKSAPRAQQIRGVAPAPLWHFELPDRSTEESSLLADGRFLITGHKGGVLAVDIVEGKKQWSRDDVLPAQILDAGHGDVLVASGGDQGEFLLLSARSGKIKWRERKYMQTPSMALLLAAGGGVLFFLTEDFSKKSEPEQAVIAYSLRRRKKLWHAPIPAGFVETLTPPGPGVVGPTLLKSHILVAGTGLQLSQDNFAYVALDRRDGRRKWRKDYDDISSTSDGLVLPLEGDLLVADTVDGLRGMSLTSGKERWTVAVKGGVNAHRAVRKGMLYVADNDVTTYAVDYRSGKVKWKRKHANPHEQRYNLSAMSLSASGRVLLRAGMAEIDALDSRDGSLMWRLAMAGVEEFSGNPGTVAASAEGMVVVDDRRSLYAFPVD
ncbi:PQQ-binding-like beta-propeller repeat protein [Streptomyces sp. PU-14G]|uniref:outer membrane protein assembly factor BamB family protein n=1 Tax=Streptomyces sp. PU-14G TaxID=2800808 RepID=UPI0034E04FB9